jgi:hypothetical protein
MLLKFDGLDTIGNFDEDYGQEEGFDPISDDHMETGNEEEAENEEGPKAAIIGYNEKRQRIRLHHKHVF